MRFWCGVHAYKVTNRIHKMLLDPAFHPPIHLFWQWQYPSSLRGWGVKRQITPNITWVWPLGMLLVLVLVLVLVFRLGLGLLGMVLVLLLGLLLGCCKVCPLFTLCATIFFRLLCGHFCCNVAIWSNNTFILKGRYILCVCPPPPLQFFGGGGLIFFNTP